MVNGFGSKLNLKVCDFGSVFGSVEVEIEVGGGNVEFNGQRHGCWDLGE